VKQCVHTFMTINNNIHIVIFTQDLSVKIMTIAITIIIIVCDASFMILAKRAKTLVKLSDVL
jgi:hypothetical protein